MSDIAQELHRAELDLSSLSPDDPEGPGVCAAQVWLAAVLATNRSAPLFAELAIVALARGWPDSIPWGQREARRVIELAIAASRGAGAPASERYQVDDGPGFSYTTNRGTRIALEERPDDWFGLVIEGPRSASVVRRMLAAADCARRPWSPEERLRQLAIMEIRLEAANEAEALIQSQLLGAAGRLR